MELRKMALVLAALGAVSVATVGCDGLGGGSTTCSQDVDCLASEVCHPDAKVCVQTCTAAADCPDSAKNCAALGTGPSPTKTVCKCSTTELCNRDRMTADQVCSSQGVCLTKCTSNADCGSNSTCNTTSGECSPASTVGQTCSGTGKTTCSYGEYCGAGSKCAAVEAPTCDNYTNFTSKDQLGTSGPMTYAASVVSAATDANWCGTGSTPKRVKVKFSAYSSTPFPAIKDDLNGLLYVKVNGTTSSGAATISSSAGNYTRSGTNNENADFIMNFCVADTSQTLSLGVYFTTGNFFCYQANF